MTSLGTKRRRVLEIVRKELLQTFRDPRMRGVVFIAPMMQLMIFGYAVSTDVRETKTFVVDHDRSRSSRDLIGTLQASGYFRVVGGSDRADDLVGVLDRGHAVVGIEVPAGFAADLARGDARLQLLLDGTNSNVATVAGGYAQTIIQNFGLASAPARPSGGIDLRERAWFNPDLKSRNYNVPAVVGIIILLVCLLLTSLSIVREKEIGTLEQLRVSPLTAGELIVGKTIPFGLIGLCDLVIVTTLAIVWFKIPFAGSFVSLLLASVLYLLPGLGIGLWISTISNTQQEAFMATFLFMMPTILLSGFMFPVSSMPLLFRYLTLLNPVRHYLEIVRAVFLKGAGPGTLWFQYTALLAMGIGILFFAARRFRQASS